MHPYALLKLVLFYSQTDQVGSFDAASIASELGADLQEVADTISQAAAVGVSTDLEAAAQGLGYGSFADAVAASQPAWPPPITTTSNELSFFININLCLLLKFTRKHFRFLQ